MWFANNVSMCVVVTQWIRNNVNVVLYLPAPTVARHNVVDFPYPFRTKASDKILRLLLRVSRIVPT